MRTRKRSGRYSIKVVIIITVSLLLVASIAATLLLINDLRSQTRAVHEQGYTANMKALNKNLSWRIAQTYYDISDFCASDITRAFVESGFANFTQMQSECRDNWFRNSDIVNIVVVSNDGQWQNFFSGDYSMISSVEVIEIIENIDSYKPMGVVGSDSKNLVLVMPINDMRHTEQVGYGVFVLSNNIFYEELRFANNVEIENYVVAYDSLPIEIILSTGYTSLPENWLAENHSLPAYSFNPFEAGGEKYYASQFTINGYGVIVYYIIPDAALASEWPVYLWLSLGLLCVVLILVFAMIIRLFVLMRDSFARVDGMLENIDGFDQHQLEQLVTVEEFYYIAERVFAVQGKIAQLNYEALDAQKRVLEKEVAKRNALLIALKNQINPHFIYNTLSCVKQLSIDGKNEPVGEICDRIVGILRYSIKNSTTAKVYEELEALESYLYIQSFRFSQDISYKIDVDSELLECDMLRFILQPILENSIMHGILAETGSGKITLSGAIEDERIVFRISDSGAGMPPETLKALRQKLRTKGENPNLSPDDGAHGIGLVNINNRIKLFYGDEYGLKISSILNVGTFVTVEFPRFIREESEQNAEGYNNR